MHILTKILVVLVALLVVALVPLAAVSSTNQFVFKQQATDAQANLKKQEAELAVASDAYNASVAALQSKVATLESQIRAATMERDKETQMRADKERDLERPLGREDGIARLAVKIEHHPRLLREKSETDVA